MMAFKKTAQILIIKRSGLAGSPSAYGTCYPRLPKETVNNEVTLAQRLVPAGLSPPPDTKNPVVVTDNPVRATAFSVAATI